jgi:ubiquinone/menaquinone biosynthesis C-methylase UbiE
MKNLRLDVTRDVVQHFSTIAPRYNDLRTTDPEVVSFLAERLFRRTPMRVADVGCGSGRYDVELLLRLGDNLELICVDCNLEMLRTLNTTLEEYDLKKCQVVQAEARDLPFPDRHLDCVLTFNAIHHFGVPGFLAESTRVIRPDGVLVVYTRTRSQNSRNIWGRLFPFFADKENRLFELGELESLIEQTPGLELEAVQNFKYHRVASLDWLLERARNHHYSTFALYGPGEFEMAMERFRRNVLWSYDDPTHVDWQDENILLIVRRVGSWNGTSSKTR